MKSKKEGSLRGLRISFNVPNDKQKVIKKLVKIEKNSQIMFQNELPPSLFALNNELLVQRRKLIGMGIKAHIKILYKFPFLQLVDENRRPLILTSWKQTPCLINWPKLF